jgi:hypothetical protein
MKDFLATDSALVNSVIAASEHVAIGLPSLFNAKAWMWRIVPRFLDLFFASIAMFVFTHALV